MKNSTTVINLLILASVLLSAFVIFRLNEGPSELGEANQMYSLGLRTVRNPVELPEQLKGVKRIVCTGDSITLAQDLGYGYVKLLQQYLQALYPGRFELINTARNGDTSATLLKRLDSDVIGQHGDLVIVSVAVNDLTTPVDELKSSGKALEAYYRSNMETIVSRIAKSGARVMLLSGFLATENPDSRTNVMIHDLSLELQAIAERNPDITLVRMDRTARDIVTLYRSRTGAADNFLTLDGVHPNASGHLIIANSILSALGVSSSARQMVQP